MLQNQTNSTNFRLDVPDQHATEQFVLNVQSASIPGLRIPVTDAPLNSTGAGRMNIPGTTTEFDPLMVRIILDEQLDAYIQVYQWMLSINDYARKNPTMWGKFPQPKAMMLHVLNNTKNDIIATFNYYNAWPSELGEIEYSYTETGDVAITCVVTFNYSYFEIEKDNKVVRPFIKGQG